MILEKSFVLFVVFSISHDIIKNKKNVCSERRGKFGRHTMGQGLFAAGRYHSFLYQRIKTADELL